MRALKWLGITILAIIGIAAATLTWLTQTRPELSELESHSEGGIPDVTGKR